VSKFQAENVLGCCALHTTHSNNVSTFLSCHKAEFFSIFNPKKSGCRVFFYSSFVGVEKKGFFAALYLQLLFRQKKAEKNIFHYFYE
jgi:hypothetical protein